MSLEQKLSFVQLCIADVLARSVLKSVINALHGSKTCFWKKNGRSGKAMVKSGINCFCMVSVLETEMTREVYVIFYNYGGETYGSI